MEQVIGCANYYFVEFLFVFLIYLFYFHEPFVFIPNVESLNHGFVQESSQWRIKGVGEDRRLADLFEL